MAPQLVTSFADFKRTYGGIVDESYLGYAVEGYFRNGGSRCYVGRVIPKDGGEVASATISETDPALTASAVGPGDWGGSVAVIVEDATLYEDGKNELFKLTIRYWADDPGSVSNLDGDDPEPAPDVEETYDNLSPAPDSSAYAETVVSGQSSLVDLTLDGTGRPSTGATWLAVDGSARTDLSEMSYSELQKLAKDYDDVSGNLSEDKLKAALSEAMGGNDDDGGSVQWNYDGNDTPGERTGLAAFAEIDDITIVCAPDENDVDGLTSKLVDHCHNMGDRFAVLQASQNPGDIADMTPPKDSSYAAYYYPWIEVMDPETNNRTLVPPGGHVAGIFARSDTENGVHAAPANEVVRGAQSLQVTITKGEQDVLNPKGVNCIRSFRGRGIRVWGARTCSSDPLWKYVNVRRLFLYIEESIDEGTQWVVFEPNNEQLWSRVKQTIRNFLTSVWEDGALMGSTPEEAFYVKCGRSTMTQNDIDNGRLICEIGIAPVKPAEFVVFRISQWTGNAD